MKTSGMSALGVLLAASLALACSSTPAVTPSAGPRVVQPGSPGEATRVIAAEDAVLPPAPYTAADVRFMQGMIPHHAQALAMTALAPTRAARPEVRQLARRIELSQLDEIALMQRWLAERSQTVPEPAIEQMHHLTGTEHEFMPGMLTHEQMASLAAATGAAFDRLFIEFMIAHHEGAVAMVYQLFNSPGGAQGDDIHKFASDVEADQTIEIRRMRALLRPAG